MTERREEVDIEILKNPRGEGDTDKIAYKYPNHCQNCENDEKEEGSSLP